MKNKGKKTMEEHESSHEKEREFKLIHLDNDEENETRNFDSLLQY